MRTEAGTTAGEETKLEALRLMEDAGWQFNLSTSNLTAGNTYAYQINLNDGTSISFQFKLP